MTIITTKKPFEEVLVALRDRKAILLISCGSCAATCQTGGTEGADEMAKKLRSKGFEVKLIMVYDEICDNRETMKNFRKRAEELKDVDVILSLSCGLGVASIINVLSQKHPNIPVLIANNTQFMGVTHRIGRFYMRCSGCGNCLLNETGGICPITTCAKALMNGPCGGMVRGKCEVGNYEKDCGWILIFNRLKELGRLDLFNKLREPVDWSESGHQREVVWR